MGLAATPTDGLKVSSAASDQPRESKIADAVSSGDIEMAPPTAVRDRQIAGTNECLTFVLPFVLKLTR